MALKLVANISKKTKIPGLDFSSVQASCSIEGEVADLAHVSDEIRRLYAIAEGAVDLQLGIQSQSPIPVSAPSTSNSAPVSARGPDARSSSRRTSAVISPAQRRYLCQLLDRNPGALAQILADHRIASIDQLGSRDASAAIDRLKGASA